MPDLNEMTTAQREKMIADLRTVIADAEELLKLTAGELGESAVGLRDRLRQRLSHARDRLLSLQDSAVDSAKSAGHAADDYVHDHPWQSAVIGMGIGLLLGMLLGQRR